MRKLALALLALLLAAAPLSALAEGAAPMDSVLGAFSTVDLAGNPVNSNVFADSKLTLVNVWATFCPPCIAEIPDLAKLDAQIDDFQVLGILGDAGSKDAVDPNNRDLGIEIAEKSGAAYPSLLPDDAINQTLMQYLTAYPTSFFVDRKGQIVGQAIVGSMGYEDWKNVINERMSQANG